MFIIFLVALQVFERAAMVVEIRALDSKTKDIKKGRPGPRVPSFL